MRALGEKQNRGGSLRNTYAGTARDGQGDRGTENVRAWWSALLVVAVISPKMAQEVSGTLSEVLLWSGGSRMHCVCVCGGGS